MDESDRLLADRLRQELESQGKACSFAAGMTETAGVAADAPTTGHGGPDGKDPDDQDEMDFLQAMERFRAARRGGDPAELAAAERDLQDFVRTEMARKESCPR